MLDKVIKRKLGAFKRSYLIQRSPAEQKDPPIVTGEVASQQITLSDLSGMIQALIADFKETKEAVLRVGQEMTGD